MQVDNQQSNAFFQLGGSLPPDFPTYVTRPADQLLYDQLLEGKFCYVLTARQMGKSSLRVRVMQRLREEKGVTCIFIDITQIGNENTTADQWYYSLLYKIAVELGIKSELLTWWKENDQLTPVSRFGEFLENVVIKKNDESIVIFIDEIDSMLNLDKEKFSTDDFFALLRSFYNTRPDNPDLNRLTFALLGVAAPNDLMKDVVRTPFNIGTAIDLHNFTINDSKPLLHGFQNLSVDRNELLKEVLFWTGGQPFLTQKLCDAISASHSKIEDIQKYVKNEVDRLFLLSKVQSEPNLSNVKNRIMQNKTYNTEMLGIYQRVLSGEEVRSDNNNFAQIYLKLSGLLSANEGKLVINNQIYEKYFNKEWLEQAFREIERPFAEASNRWLSLNKSPDAVLRGDALDYALKWARGRNDLSAIEYEYLDACRDQQQKELAKKQRQKIIRIVWIFLIGLFSSLLVFGYIFFSLRSATKEANAEAAVEKAKAETAIIAAEEEKVRADLASARADKQEAFAAVVRAEAEEVAVKARTEREKALAERKIARANAEAASLAKDKAVFELREAELLKDSLFRYSQLERIKLDLRIDSLTNLVNLSNTIPKAHSVRLSIMKNLMQSEIGPDILSWVTKKYGKFVAGQFAQINNQNTEQKSVQDIEMDKLMDALKRGDLKPSE